MVKKQILKFVTVIMLVILSASNVFAAAPNHSSRVIRVGYYKFDGYQMESSDHTRSGYGYDFLQELARYTGWTYEYVGYNLGWAELQKMLDNGEIDILTSARKTPEREQKYLFSTDIGTSRGILTVKSGNTHVTMGDYPTYNNMRVGMIKDSSINENFRTFAQSKGFSYTPVYFKNVDELNLALQNEDGIDAVCTTNLRRVQNEWILDQFDQANFYVMLNSKSNALQQEINDAIYQMDVYTPGWRTTLKNKYYKPDVGEQIALSADEKSFVGLSSSRTFTAVVNPDNAPYSYFKNGKAEGIIPEIFNEIAARSGLKFKIIETADRKAYTAAITDPSADIVLDTCFDYDRAEKSGRKLTIPYLSTPLSQVSRKGANGVFKKSAFLSYGDNTYNGQIRLSPKTITTYYPSITDCLEAVDSGKADVTYTYPYIVQKYLEAGHGSQLSVTLLPQYNISFALSVLSSDDNRLLTILNKAVASVNSDYTNQVILSQMTTAPAKVTFISFFERNPYAKLILVIILAALICSFVIAFTRQKNLRLICEKNRQLNEAVQKATEANEAKSNFLSGMSHDMRTPLNGIIGFANFAYNEQDISKKQEDIRKIQQASSILVSLINDTLELSRIESGKFVLEPVFFSCNDFVNSIAVVIQAAADKKNIHFIRELSSPKNACLYADRLKLQELCLNLLSNAVKYTNNGGIVRFSMSLQTQETGNILCIVSEDSGIGISKEFMPKLFDAFAQEKRDETTASVGSGLGLAIVRRIVDLMNGTIDVKSEKDKGSTFTVMLPVEVSEKETSDDEKNTHETLITKLTGKHVLLCEDNDMNTEIAKRLLESVHLSVTCAENGKTGAELFSSASENYFDFILMDIHMPVMDGFEATKLIRSMSRADAKTVPIIAMTADAYNEDVVKCLSCGMNAHIAKPIEPDKLFDTLFRFSN